MEFTKKRLIEIIDTNGDLIGTNAIPNNDGNADTVAHGTTDQNVSKGQQPFRYDMLGRFGFSMMPFMEGKEGNQGETELINDLHNLMFERYLEILKFYYKNPNKLKSDYRKMSDGDVDPDKDVNYDYADKIMKIVEKHFQRAFKPEQIDEAKVAEDRMVNKKSEDEITKKSEDKDVRSSRLEKIAGLINKLEKKDIDKLINLLERK